MTKEELLDICWTLFESVRDIQNPYHNEGLINACLKLVSQEDFDINALPENLYEYVKYLYIEEKKEAYYDF